MIEGKTTKGKEMARHTRAPERQQGGQRLRAFRTKSRRGRKPASKLNRGRRIPTSPGGKVSLCYLFRTTYLTYLLTYVVPYVTDLPTLGT